MLIKKIFGVLMVAATILNPVAICSAQTKGRSISIETEPQAKIWLNGVLYGTTSETGVLKIDTVSPGRKTIRVRADGFREKQQALGPAQSGRVAIPLTKTTDKAELLFQEAERLTTIDRQKAIAAFDQAIKLKPNYLDAYIGLARVHLDAGNFDEAGQAIAGARSINRDISEASAIEGRILKSVGEEAKAIAAYKRAIREGRGFQPEAYAGLGLLFKEKAENAAGESDFEREKTFYSEAAKYLAVSIDQLSGAPDSVVLYQLLGLIYEDQKQFDKAIDVYEEFLRRFPNNNEAPAVRSFIVQIRKAQSTPK